jgi:hypothetical protein
MTRLISRDRPAYRRGFTKFSNAYEVLGAYLLKWISDFQLLAHLDQFLGLQELASGLHVSGLRRGDADGGRCLLHLYSDGAEVDVFGGGGNGLEVLDLNCFRMH